MASTNLSVCCLNSSIHLLNSRQSRCGPKPRCLHLRQTPSRESGFSSFRWCFALASRPLPNCLNNVSGTGHCRRHLTDGGGAQLWQILSEFFYFFRTEAGPLGLSAHLRSARPGPTAAWRLLTLCAPTTNPAAALQMVPFFPSWGRLISCTRPSTARDEARAQPGFWKSKLRKARNCTCGTILISTQGLI